VIRLPCSSLLVGTPASAAVRHARHGKAAEALASLEKALVEARESNDLVRVGGVLGCMGLVLENLGRSMEARVRLQAAISLFRSRRARTEEAAFIAVLAEIRATNGEMDAARRALEVSETVLREEEAWTELGSCLVRRGVVEILANDHILAWAALSDAREVCATEAVYAEIDQAVGALHMSQELAAVA